MINSVMRLSSRVQDRVHLEAQVGHLEVLGNREGLFPTHTLLVGTEELVLISEDLQTHLKYSNSFLVVLILSVGKEDNLIL